MRNNIALLRTYWGAKDKGVDSGKKELIEFTQADRRSMAPALFQTLSLLTPVISSTFASIGRMFEDIQIGKDPLFGLLIIDEAGQAVPYAALGALARSRRAMIVGDPSQIEPVITGDVKELRAVLGKKYYYLIRGIWLRSSDLPTPLTPMATCAATARMINGLAARLWFTVAAYHPCSIFQMRSRIRAPCLTRRLAQKRISLTAFI